MAKWKVSLQPLITDLTGSDFFPRFVQSGLNTAVALGLLFPPV
jgi:hypothetical protein